MKLFSCDECGVVLDAEKINWPSFKTKTENDPRFTSIGGMWVQTASCPVCDSEIYHPQ